MKRFEVEYNFVETPWGRRPMNMRGFDTRAEANAFALNHEDSNVVEVLRAYRFTTTGEKVRIW